MKSLYEANRALVDADPEEGPHHQFTLLDIAPVLSVHSFRVKEVYPFIRDPMIKAWWVEQFYPKSERDRVEMISPVLTKMNKFSASVLARRIVGQPTTTVRFDNAITDKKIILIRTPRGIVGEDIASIVGSSLLGLLRVHIAAQASLPFEKRVRMRILVDEYQTLPGVAWESMLPELRKYKANFALATQSLGYLDKLDPLLRAILMSNIAHLFAFGMSADDARMLERELDGGIDAADLIAQDNFQCYAKLTIDRKVFPVFNFHLDPPFRPDEELACQIRMVVRNRYSHLSLDEIDHLIEVSIERHMRYVVMERDVKNAFDPGHVPDEDSQKGASSESDNSSSQNEDDGGAEESGQEKKKGRRKKSTRPQSSPPLLQQSVLIPETAVSGPKEGEDS
jgi:hypothetical protein